VRGRKKGGDSYSNSSIVMVSILSVVIIVNSYAVKSGVRGSSEVWSRSEYGIGTS